MSKTTEDELKIGEYYNPRQEHLNRILKNRIEYVPKINQTK